VVMKLNTLAVIYFSAVSPKCDARPESTESAGNGLFVDRRSGSPASFEVSHRKEFHSYPQVLLMTTALEPQAV
jgi:hypothetical protein